MKRVILLCVTLCLSASADAQEKFLGKTADAWVQQLKTGTPKERKNAAYSLGKMGKSSAFVLADMKAVLASEKDAKTRDALVFALGEICRSSPEARSDGNLETMLLTAL